MSVKAKVLFKKYLIAIKMKKCEKVQKAQKIHTGNATPSEREKLMETYLNSVSEILDSKLYLSGWRPVTADSVTKLKISAIVRILTETEEAALDFEGSPFFDPSSSNGVGSMEKIRLMRISLMDADEEAICKFFDQAAKFIHDELKNGGRILVHCGAGISRSTTLVLAYLMKYKNMSLRNAYALVKARRRIARPNNGFFHQLIQYEKVLREKTSVRMIRMTNGRVTPDVVFESEIMAKLL